MGGKESKEEVVINAPMQQAASTNVGTGDGWAHKVTAGVLAIAATALILFALWRWLRREIDLRISGSNQTSV